MRQWRERFWDGGVALVGAAVVLIATVVAFVAFPSGKLLALGGMGVLALALCTWLSLGREDSDDAFVRAFAVAFVVMGLCYLFFFPPGTVPDEESHYRTSYVYANLVSPGYEVDSARAEDFDMINMVGHFEAAGWHGLVSNERWRGVIEALSDMDAGPLVTDPELIASNYFGNAPDPNTLGAIVSRSPIQLKLGSVVGILVARILNLGAIHLFYLGRLGGFLFAAALVIAAVRITPVGKKLFAAVALLPMSLHLLASYSSDGGIIGLTLLLSACVVRALVGEEPLSRRGMAAMLVLVLLLAPCKYVYVLVALPLFLLPNSKFAGGKRACVVFKLLLVVAALAGVVVFSLPRVLLVTNASGAGAHLSRRGTETGTFYSPSYLLTHPVESARLIARSASREIGRLLEETVGHSLGWLQPDLVTPTWTSVLLWALIALAGLRSEGDEMHLAPRYRIACVLVLLMGFVGCYAGMMVTWTFVTETEVIIGMQGRYFVQYLPLAFLGLRPARLAIPRRLDVALLVAFVVYNVGLLQYLSHAVS